jgi:7-cyano-7-deazaguanine synthase
MSAALVLFSAGQDSATCLAWALSQFDRVETIGFAYGQRHAVEMAQRPIARAVIAGLQPGWAARLGEDVVVDLSGYGALAESALTADRAIEMTASGLPSTFVPRAQSGVSLGRRRARLSPRRQRLGRRHV